MCFAGSDRLSLPGLSKPRKIDHSLTVSQVFQLAQIVAICVSLKRGLGKSIPWSDNYSIMWDEVGYIAQCQRTYSNGSSGYICSPNLVHHVPWTRKVLGDIFHPATDKSRASSSVDSNLDPPRTCRSMDSRIYNSTLCRLFLEHLHHASEYVSRAGQSCLRYS